MIPLAVLAGGASTRMGTDKLALPVAGVPQLARLAALHTPVWICGRPRPPDWAGPAATWLTDDPPGCGPLGGLAAALAHALTLGLPEVLLVAGDLPWLDAAALAWLRDLPAPPPGVVTAIDGRIEPLAARYHVSLLPLIRARLADGRRSVLGVAEGLPRVEVPPSLQRSWRDADTPDQWPR